ncbi:hypothetical protein KWL01_015905 [Clostridioides difficile]|uniref:hypothetical protein n=1 Tax=Clostridioides difficile TaxID=1496 RepID=UPI00097FFBED|nr:hypothetical protein [Clostridioides difficile]MBZ1283449.1 hypothetical protein [Clostridioides difficile]MCR1391454.1 hypothetical protein [Clostridioides difficile]MDI3075215.1 hypothetical protein [Clostridioides difficile]MDK3169329.1 hypothetical protein [Clostridioides difficile]SJP68915.1 Uncharacterised protein [Clostridioides difficile]
MWNKFKSLNTLNKIFFGIIAFVIFPITITAFLGELSIKLLSNGFKNKKKLKIISGFIAAYFFIACATSTFLIYKDSFKNSSETAKMSTGESEVQADKNIDSKDKKDVKLSEDEQKISKVTNLAPEQVQNTAKILKECGIEEFESIKHDEGLDNAHFDGEKGYRIEFGGSKNIILYMNKDNSVYNVRWADNDFYKDGKVVSKVSDYTLTIDEKTALQLQCQNGVSAVLKSPSTAKFPNITKWMFSKNKEEIVVQSYVDSQNSFGATMRSEFQIIFTSDGKDVKSFIFDGKEMIK